MSPWQPVAELTVRWSRREVLLLSALGALTRRNGITIFLSIELMLSSVNLILVAYSRALVERAGDLGPAFNGQILVFFALAVAAAEAAVGLALFIAIYRNRRTIDINRLNLMRW